MSRVGQPGGFWDGPRKRRRRKGRPNGGKRRAVWFQIADGRGRFLGVFLDGADVDQWASRHPGRGFWLSLWESGRIVRRWTLAVNLSGGVSWAEIEAREGGRRGQS